MPPLQLRVMAAAADAPNLASSVNIGAFNLGNALGAALGGAVIAAGLGYPAVALAGRGDLGAGPGDGAVSGPAPRATSRAGVH